MRLNGNNPIVDTEALSTYSFIEYKGREDVEELVRSIRNVYSTIERIVCTDFYDNVIREYDDPDIFLAELQAEDINNIAVYCFICPYTFMSIVLNIREQTISYEKDIASIEEKKRKEMEPEFYLYNGRLVVKRIPYHNSFEVWNKDLKKWEYSPGMYGRFDDPGYDFLPLTEYEANTYTGETPY